MKFCCHITETTDHEIIVEAETEEEAEKLALQDHIEGHSNFNGVQDRSVVATPSDP